MISLHGTDMSRVDRIDPRYLALIEANAGVAAKDAEIWGSAAASEAAIRLNWVDAPSLSRQLLPQLDALAARFRNHDHVVLCGMGGSSLAPEVIAATFHKELFVMDSTDPDYISKALIEDLSKTVVVVSSKSGSTIETTSQRALFEERFTQAGLDPKEHMVIVTDPGSPLDADARQRGFEVVNADPNVGGRYSALTAFGLVPAALLGIDVSLLLDAASEELTALRGEDSPAVLAAYLIAYEGGQYVAFSDGDAALPGLSDWIEQLIAESTGKEHVGRLPVVIESNNAPVAGAAIRVAFTGKSDLVVEGDLGSQFIFWEWTTALLGRALNIDPFNQPNVTEAKEKTNELLAKWAGQAPALVPNFVDGAVEIFANAESVQDALTQVIDSVSDDGYIAIMAYLDRREDAQLGELRQVLAEKSSRPVTFGWGPRFLHSTGQFHKGGQQNGVFLQITGESREDIAIPGKEFTFKTLITAQALGDGQTLTDRGLKLIRLHLQNRTDGISEILSAARAIS